MAGALALKWWQESPEALLKRPSLINPVLYTSGFSKWEENRLKLTSQYINFSGCPLPLAQPLGSPLLAGGCPPSQLQALNQRPRGCSVVSVH